MENTVMSKKMKKALLVSLLLFISFLECATSHIVTFFIDEYPEINNSINKGKSPHIIRKHANNHGIYCTHYGYKTISDTNGQVTFPLKQTEKSFHILVMKNPTPQFMLYNTIHHFMVSERTEFDFYSIQQKEDTKLKLTFWDVQKDTLPKDRHIPLDTIIVYAHPDEIYIPTGASITQKGAQLVLPTIYAKSTIQLSKNVIAFLDNSEFFAAIERGIKIEQLDGLTKI
jgi:hypothetical protein